MAYQRFSHLLFILCCLVCATSLATAEPIDAPAPRYGKDGNPASDFLARHESFLKRGRAGPAGLLFIGDSITDWWTSVPVIWKEHFDAYQPANFGIAGDRIQNVLWRIANGELDGISPRVVVLLIGTNNIKASSEDILKGELKIIEQIHAKLPQSKLLVLGIFPRGVDPTDPKVAEMRDKIVAVNKGLAKLDDGHLTRYLDLAPKFLDANGVLSKDLMPDALHPHRQGYQIWAESMQPLLDEMLDKQAAQP